MSGVSSPVYGSGGGSGGAKLPSNVLSLSGTIRDEAVDWSAGATCVAVLEMSAANPGSDTQISGGLWATATGLEFTDGTNTAVRNTSWESGDNLIVRVSTTANGKMQIATMGDELPPTYLTNQGDVVWDMSETSPAWGTSSIDGGEIGEFVTAEIGGRAGRFAHLKAASGSSAAHADIYRGVITTSPASFPTFTTSDTFTLAVYCATFSGDDATNANASSTTPYVDVRFSSAAGKEIGGLFRLMRKVGWQYITLRASDFTLVTGGEVITNTMQRVYIRCFNNATSGVGAEFYIGPMWLNKKSRPKLIIELDDGWLSTYTQAFPYCQARGVNLSIPTAAEAIGTNDAVYCNWSQVEEMAAAGFEFTVHSNKSHTVELTSYEEVYADTVDKIERLASHGIRSTHYVYPQGKFDSTYSFQALTDAGIVTAAHTAGGPNLAISMPIDIPLMLPRSPMNHTIGSAATIAEIDKAISKGTLCRLYGHKVLGPLDPVSNADLELTYAEFAAIIDAAVAYRDADLIDIVTVEDLRGGFVKFDGSLTPPVMGDSTIADVQLVFTLNTSSRPATIVEINQVIQHGA